MQILFPKGGLNFHFQLWPRRVEKARFGIHFCVSKSRVADGALTAGVTTREPWFKPWLATYVTMVGHLLFED